MIEFAGKTDDEIEDKVIAFKKQRRFIQKFFSQEALSLVFNNNKSCDDNTMQPWGFLTYVLISKLIMYIIILLLLISYMSVDVDVRAIFFGRVVIVCTALLISFWYCSFFFVCMSLLWFIIENF